MYSEHIIEDLKSKADIVQIIGNYTSLTKQGNVYIGKCPFENSDIETLIVSPDKKVFHCLNCVFY